jgi:hypothetical protein
MSGTCYRCGQGLGFFASNSTICDPCANNRGAALQAWLGALDQALDDRCLTLQEERRLRQYQAQLGLWDQEIAAHLPRIQRGKVFAAVMSGMLPIVQSPVRLQANEAAHLCVPATLLEERTHREWQSGSRGVSVRVMKGVSVRLGASRGQYVPVSEMAAIAQGHFVITNQRVVFMGAHLLVIEHADLIGFEWFADGLRLDYAKRRKPQYIHTGDGEYAAAVLLVASRGDEVRPAVGTYGFLHDNEGGPVTIFPDDADLMRIGEYLQYGDEAGANAWAASMPKVEPGTRVLVGEPSGMGVAVQIQDGPFAGRWGFVIVSSLRMRPPS